MPVLVRYNTKIIDLSGKISIVGGEKFGSIRIGFGGVSEFDEKQRSIVKLTGNLNVMPPVYFGAMSRIIIEKNANVSIGRNFNNTANLTISSRGSIYIGCNVLVSWGTWICDTDFHTIKNMETGQFSNPDGKVVIGDDVWICAHSSIMKNAYIPNGCIVGTNSLVRNKFSQEHTLLAGIPASIKNYNISYIP